MTQKYQVKVSMKQAAIVETGIVLKQGDFGMQIEIEVLDFDVTGTTPQIVFRKAMGAVESTTITVSSNKYTYTFKGTELDTPGKVFCDLKLKNSTTQRISTASFMFKVVADTLDGLAEESSSYSDTIAQLIGPINTEIDAINAELDEQFIKERTVNLFDKEALSNYYRYNSTGSLIGDGTPQGAAPGYFITDWIEVTPSTKYYYNNIAARITEFNISKQFVNNISPANVDNFTATENTKYIRLSIPNTSQYENSLMVTLYDNKPNEYIPYYNTTLNEDIVLPQISPLAEDINENASNINILDNRLETIEKGYTITNGKYWRIVNNKVTKSTYANLSLVDPIPIVQNDQFYIYTKGKGDGYSYYITDAESSPLAYGTADEINQIITANASTAAFLYVNISVDYLNTFKIAKITDNSLNDIVVENCQRIDELEKCVICCTGDSVTQGMRMDGSGTADYGKEPYPAQLTTLLVDNGYKNVKVYNQGHGGELISDVAARIGGRVCFLTEDITIPSDNSWVSLGTSVVTDHQITGTKLRINFKNKNNQNYCVFFSQLGTDTSPLYIDGISYDLKIENSTNYIKKTTADGVATAIKAGTAVYTSDKRTPDVNIIYAGYNGRSAFTLDKWLKLNKACAEVNGLKYIIIGSTVAIWEEWDDVEGENAAERYEYYKTATYDAFGIHFLDLYTEFFEHALPYALEGGYFSTATQEELEEMEGLLQQHILPAEFSYDGAHEGNVHPNAAGYYVFARLLFDKLKRLNYIPEIP